MNALAVLAGVAVVGFIVYSIKGGSLKKGDQNARGAGLPNRYEQERSMAQQAAAEQKARERDKALEEIERQAEAYGEEYYRYALRDQSYAMNLDLNMREELKKRYNARDTCPTFEIASACRNKGFSAILVMECLNEYLKTKYNATATDPRIPAATLDTLLQKKAVERARETIQTFMNSSDL